MKKIVDVCLVNDETFLLESRLAYLSSIVSHSIFVEADYTHSGRRKVGSIADRLAKRPLGSCEVVRVSIPKRVREKGNRWAIEEYSRQWAVEYASSKNPSSIIMISDIDEIPSREQVSSLNSELETRKVVSLPMVVSYGYVNLVDRGGKAFWRKAKAFQSEYRSFSIRLDFAPSVTGPPGQHFRYLALRAPGLAQKHGDYAHEELDIAKPLLAEVLSLAAQFDVAPLPLVNQPGAGLLTDVHRKGMTGPAEFILKTEPNLVREVFHRQPFLTRIVASQRISNIYAHGASNFQSRCGEKKDWILAISSLFFQVAAHLGLTRFLAVLRRVVVVRRPFPGQRFIDFLRGVSIFGDWEIQKHDELENATVMYRALPVS